MKTYTIRSISFVMAILSMVACKDNFEEDVIHQGGEVLEEQFLVNPDFVKTYLDNIYNHLPNRYDLDFDGAMLASATDEAVNSNLNSPVNTLTNGTWSPVRTFDEGYEDFYNGIRKANLFLSFIDRATVTPINNSIDRDSTIKIMKGQAFFFRAYFHFELFKRYGEIVLATRVFDRDEDLNLPKNSLEEVIDQIALDCDSAIVRLPKWNHELLGEEGRVTRVAAMALKSRLFLYAASPLHNPAGDVEKWQRAADAAKLVIDTGFPKLHDNYADIFNYSTAAYNSEVILATKADNVNSIEINNAPVSYEGAKGRTNPTQELVDAFETEKGMFITEDPDYDPQNPYVDRDPRFAMTIHYNGAMFKELPVETYVGGKDGLNRNNNATKTGYYMRKFLSENARWNSNADASVRRPWVLIRYAEILLNYAEALNEAQGPVEDVYEYVNKVRERVGMPELPLHLDKDAMRERIHHERRIELVFEGHRFFDVRRWKKGEEIFNKPVSGMRIIADETGTPVSYERFQVQNRAFEEKHYFYPFPQLQINLHPALKQNKDW